MGKFDGVLLASDFDNTLIYTEGTLKVGKPTPPLPDNNRRALEYFIAEGGRFAVATGRALAMFQPLAHMVPMNSPGIVCNGAALFDFEAGEYLATRTMHAEAHKRGQAVLERFPAIAVEAYHIENTIFAVQPNDVTRRHNHQVHVDLAVKDSLEDVPQPLGKLLFEGSRADLEQAVAFIQKQGWAEDYEIIFSAEELLEVTMKGATKGGMVRHLADRLGISMEHVYCTGDEANDISMLTAAKEGFAPANCSAAVRACGATIVAHAEEGTIADIIRILNERY